MRAAFLGSFLIALTLILSAAPASAHHSFGAEFDSHQFVTLTGRVTKVEWMNPHIYFYIDTKDAHFAIQGSTPNVLARVGWTRDSLKPGDLITVSGYKSRDGWNRLNAREVIFADGRKVSIGGGAEPSYNN